MMTNRKAIPTNALMMLRRKRRWAFSSGDNFRSGFFSSGSAGRGWLGTATGANWTGDGTIGLGAAGMT
jgi:hypothetical protein